MRVPILRPRLAAWLDGAMMAAALVSALSALRWQGMLSVSLLAVVGAILGVAAGAALLWRRRSAGRPGASHAVRAVRMDRDGAFHLRLRDGWYPAEWTAAWRGPRWLTLRARVGARGAGGGSPSSLGRCVTFTVWQDALPAPAWRRTCMLTARRLCRTPSRRAVGTP
ncbi:hypothetical protein CAL26_07885 [Bordetella genomosp. 9]|uniref:Uncharacterized protein n=1 Tax=Bordetella genomosp. 9 TaxID=1416803 RepID=A0A261REC3_9BORD|nr:hypothetical protein CAL26_07885 [Bordetella genomosp. 9]